MAVEAQSVGVTASMTFAPSVKPSPWTWIGTCGWVTLNAGRFSIFCSMKMPRCTRAEMQHQCGRRSVETSGLPRDRHEW
jgi:hypothetical protein